MAKSGPKPRGRPRATEEGAARAALVRAAIDTLRTDGVVGASARAIAARAGVSSAAVFYHFGTVNDLLLAALDVSSGQRLERYRVATADIDNIPALMRLFQELVLEDDESGHIAVMATMVGGGAAIPGLGAQIAQRVDPWVELATDVVERVSRSLGLANAIDAKAIARLVVALALGVELLAQLQPDAIDTSALLHDAGKVFAVFTPLLGATK